jgi:hypothetical protein
MLLHAIMPAHRPHITVSSLVFCVTVLYGQHTRGLGTFWAADVGGVCLAGATAAAAVLLTACLVLPSAASEEVGDNIKCSVTKATAL